MCSGTGQQQSTVRDLDYIGLIINSNIVVIGAVSRAKIEWVYVHGTLESVGRADRQLLATQCIHSRSLASCFYCSIACLITGESLTRVAWKFDTHGPTCIVITFFLLATVLCCNLLFEMRCKIMQGVIQFFTDTGPSEWIYYGPSSR